MGEHVRAALLQKEVDIKYLLLSYELSNEKCS